jgi:hypothetical protein
MRASARLLCALLALAPLAGCRHGGEGLAAGRQPDPKPARPEPTASDHPAPLRPARVETGLPTGYRLLPPPPPRRHSGAPASIHTFHLFAPRHP